MIQSLFSPRWHSLGVCGAVAAMFAGLTASPALASTIQSGTAFCPPAQLSQPFLSASDSNWYVLASGQTVDNFDGAGWKLSEGAKLVTTQLADGQTGQVLDLPTGAKAVSPAICVQSDFQTARTLVRDMNGSGRVSFYVSYSGTSSAHSPQNTGQIDGNQTDWTLSDPINLAPATHSGQQQARYTFISGGNASDFQIYNFWIDPRMSG